MTREEAIKIAQGLITDFKCESDTMVDFCNTVIKALEQEPCNDAISREAAIKTIEKYADEYESRANRIDTDNPAYPAYHAKKKWNGRALGLDKAKEILTGLPPVTLQQKTGRWIIKDGKEQGYDIAGIKTWYIQIVCDKCGFIKTAIEGRTGQYKFCPNCGQPKMQEVEE